MARTLFFRMVFRKFSEITKNKPIFSQYNIFYNYEHFFFQSAFWSLFNHRRRSQSNQEQCSMCCSSPCFLVLLCTHYGLLQCFLTQFRKLKEIGVLRPVFPDYVISCDYGKNERCCEIVLKYLEILFHCWSVRTCFRNLGIPNNSIWKVSNSWSTRC